MLQVEDFAPMLRSAANEVQHTHGQLPYGFGSFNIAGNPLPVNRALARVDRGVRRLKSPPAAPIAQQTSGYGADKAFHGRFPAASPRGPIWQAATGSCLSAHAHDGRLYVVYTIQKGNCGVSIILLKAFQAE